MVVLTRNEVKATEKQASATFNRPLCTQQLRVCVINSSGTQQLKVLDVISCTEYTEYWLQGKCMIELKEAAWKKKHYIMAARFKNIAAEIPLIFKS